MKNTLREFEPRKWEPLPSARTCCASMSNQAHTERCGRVGGAAAYSWGARAVIAKAKEAIERIDRRFPGPDYSFGPLFRCGLASCGNWADADCYGWSKTLGGSFYTCVTHEGAMV